MANGLIYDPYVVNLRVRTGSLILNEGEILRLQEYIEHLIVENKLPVIGSYLQADCARCERDILQRQENIVCNDCIERLEKLGREELCR